MAVDKNKNLDAIGIKFDIKKAFNTIENLSQDLRDQAYKLDIDKAKSKLKSPPFWPNFGVGLGLGLTYVALQKMNLNPGVLWLVASGIFIGRSLKIASITEPFRDLIEKPLKFNLIDLNSNKVLSKSDLLNIGAELPDPIKFYELGDSNFKFKISKPNLTETKNGVSEFIKKETKNAGKPDEEHSYTWDNQKSAEYALVFDEESLSTIKQILQIYERTETQKKVDAIKPYAIPAVGGSLMYLLAQKFDKPSKPNFNTPSASDIVPSNASDLTTVQRRRSPTRKELIRRLNK